MPHFPSRVAAAVLSSVLLLAPPASGGVVFSDDFSSGASPLWGNERGAWVSAGGTYFAQQPNNSPPTYTSLPFTMTDFSLDTDINQISDGGIWLRSDSTGDGILLVTGGHLRTGTGLYWHVVHNNVAGDPLDEQTGLFKQGDDVHLRVTVSGDTYAAFLNGSSIPATTLTTDAFTSGRVALYDFSGQRFDNVVLSGMPDNLPGDANGDGRVDFADLLILAQHFGTKTGGTWATGDFDMNGRMDFADLLTLAQHYGQSAAPGPAVAAVPEPLAVPWVILLLPRGRRRRRCP